MHADDVRAALLRHARASVAAWVRNTPPPDPPAGGALDVPRAVFVSLRLDQDLRGCVGHLDLDLALGVVVGRTAVAAARDDLRFGPLTERELERVRFEISVIGERWTATADQVVPGRHGVIVRRRSRSGLLLPQVASEYGWGTEELLDMASRKARMPSGAWRDPESIVELFEAEVFGE
jgi:AmmeMemoRadiSam system protein A